MANRCVLWIGVVALSAVSAGSVQAQHSMGVSVTIPERPVVDDVRWEVHAAGDGVAVRPSAPESRGDGTRVLRHAWLGEAGARAATAVFVVEGGLLRLRLGESAGTGLESQAGDPLVVSERALPPGTHRRVLTRVLASHS